MVLKLIIPNQIVSFEFEPFCVPFDITESTSLWELLMLD